MAFIYSNDNEIVMNTTITAQGKRNLLMSGSLGVAKFALSDDGINYKLLHNDSINSIGIKMLPLTESSEFYEIKYTLCPGKQNMIKSNIETSIVPEDTELAHYESGSIVFEYKTSVSVNVYVFNPNIDESKYTLTAMLVDDLGVLDIISDLPNNQSEYDYFNIVNKPKKIILFKNKFIINHFKCDARQQHTKIKISPSELLLVNDAEINILVKQSFDRTGEQEIL